MKRMKPIVPVNVVLGAWLLIAPWIIGYSASTVQSFNDIGLGLLLIACSWWILAAHTGQIGVSTLELLAGLWLIAAPFVLHYVSLSRASINDIVVGILSVMVSAAATWMLMSKQTLGSKLKSAA